MRQPPVTADLVALRRACPLQHLDDAQCDNAHERVGKKVEHQGLADFRRDPGAFHRTTETLANAEVALAIAEEEWLRIELLREEMGGA